MGLSESAAEFFPDAAWQRCVVHWYRNIFSHVPSSKVRDIAAMLKAIHAGEDIAAARQKAVQVIEKLRGLRLTKAADIVETAVDETLAYYTFPEEHWRRIRTNNPLERILREIRRRTRVVGAFPDGQSALQPCRGQAAPHRRHRLVDQALSEHRAAEGAEHERCHHRVSQFRAPLSPNQMCEKLWTLPTAVEMRS